MNEHSAGQVGSTEVDPQWLPGAIGLPDQAISIRFHVGGMGARIWFARGGVVLVSLDYEDVLMKELIGAGLTMASCSYRLSRKSSRRTLAPIPG
ncbi:hypothetical protein NITHO_4060002 [Nitrolancea hollandica Lb]|uniref:Uncharacterized protein n=1 Tax=Nitrolancea hollandica Lb TaxID=1129897 RepID=I4EJI6_9BACT|nr:hypothetical protein NITHO_4060002 [Nitrolancea hollandica Lb]